MQSARIFNSIEELKKDGAFNQETVYHFEDYVNSFLDNREAIKQDFLELYRMMVHYLIELDNRKRFEDIFCSDDKQLFVELRQVLHDASFDEQYKFTNIQNLFKKLGLPNFSED